MRELLFLACLMLCCYVGSTRELQKEIPFQFCDTLPSGQAPHMILSNGSTSPLLYLEKGMRYEYQVADLINQQLWVTVEELDTKLILRFKGSTETRRRNQLDLRRRANMEINPLVEREISKFVVQRVSHFNRHDRRHHIVPFNIICIPDLARAASFEIEVF